MGSAQVDHIYSLPFKGRARVGMGEHLKWCNHPIPIPTFPLKGKEKNGST